MYNEKVSMLTPAVAILAILFAAIAIWIAIYAKNQVKDYEERIALNTQTIGEHQVKIEEQESKVNAIIEFIQQATGQSTPPEQGSPEQPEVQSPQTENNSGTTSEEKSN